MSALPIRDCRSWTLKTFGQIGLRDSSRLTRLDQTLFHKELFRRRGHFFVPPFFDPLLLLCAIFLFVVCCASFWNFECRDRSIWNYPGIRFARSRVRIDALLKKRLKPMQRCPRYPFGKPNIRHSERQNCRNGWVGTACDCAEATKVRKIGDHLRLVTTKWQCQSGIDGFIGLA